MDSSHDDVFPGFEKLQCDGLPIPTPMPSPDTIPILNRDDATRFVPEITSSIPPPPATLTASPDSAPAAETARKPGHSGRRSRFNKDDDLLLVREVAAAKAHIAPNGQTRERFEVAASKANATKRLSVSVTWKSVQDRYKRLQERFDKYDGMEARMSGVGGEVGEMEELLGMMKEARDDMLEARNEQRWKQVEEEEKKERLGAFIRQRAKKRQEGKREDTELEIDASTVDGAPSSVKNPRRSSETDVCVGDEEASAFTEALAKGDARRHELDSERLELEKARIEAEKLERAMDREKRKKVREEAAKLELQKFRLMLELFREGQPAAPSGPSKDQDSAAPR